MRALLERFSSGQTLYVPGATGEIQALTRALAGDPERMRGVTLISCLLPGINDFDYASLDGEARLITFSLPKALRPSFDAGRVSLIASSYGGIAAYLRNAATIDTAVAHLWCRIRAGCAPSESPLTFRRSLGVPPATGSRW